MLSLVSSKLASEGHFRRRLGLRQKLVDRYALLAQGCALGPRCTGPAAGGHVPCAADSLRVRSGSAPVPQAPARSVHSGLTERARAHRAEGLSAHARCAGQRAACEARRACKKGDLARVRSPSASLTTGAPNLAHSAPARRVGATSAPQRVQPDPPGTGTSSRGLQSEWASRRSTGARAGAATAAGRTPRGGGVGTRPPRRPRPQDAPIFRARIPEQTRVDPPRSGCE